MLMTFRSEPPATGTQCRHCPFHAGEYAFHLIHPRQRYDSSDFSFEVLTWVLVVQELGREGVLPFSSFFSSNKPFNAPLAGLFTQYLISVLLIVLAPPGDAYLFIVNCKSPSPVC